VIALILALICCAGLAHLGVGCVAVYRFAGWRPPHGDNWRPVTVLKPLYGDEPDLYDALRSFCRQDYPQFQIIFGVRDPHDPALDVVERLKAEMPHVDIECVIDAILHGSNRKVSNLINMSRAAKYDLYVISDSDMHVKDDYLRRVVTEFDDPTVGLVTSLYTGRPVYNTVISDLAVSNINHLFMPSALVGMWLCRRSDCFGATMALARSTLEAIGGWATLSDQLADDFVLGREVKARGFAVRLAPVLPETTVNEPDLESLLAHEMRWARTIRTMAPIGSIVGLIQYPVSFAVLALLASGLQMAYVELLAGACAARILSAWAINKRLGLINLPFWLMPIRDITSFGIVLASYFSRRVQWRGHSMVVETDGTVMLKEIDGE
jgi:ceramide glucosyltransferase